MRTLAIATLRFHFLVLGLLAIATSTAPGQISSGGSTFPPRRGAAITADSTTQPSGTSSTTRSGGPRLAPLGSGTTASGSRAPAGGAENYFQKKRTTAQPQSTVIDSSGQTRVLTPRSGSVSVKSGGILPSDDGQVWQEYDISPYTLRVKGISKPEQAVIDWILRETGTDVWFGTPLGVLSADSRTLRCYHTPQMQKTVRGIVERFVNGSGESHILGIRVMTLSNPSWRSRAYPLLKPVDVKSPGVEAWLLTRENAAVLVADLKRRSDYRELNAPNLQIQSGQSETIARTTPKQYRRSVRPASAFPGYETVAGQIEEGFALNVSSLMSLDGGACDVVVKCNIDQVEKLVPISLDVPVGGVTQKVQIDVPQFVSWRLHERFRWPSDQILLLSCGVVASPTGDTATPIPLLGNLSGSSRSDALLMIEHKGAGYLGPVEFVPSPLAPAATNAPIVTPSAAPAATTATPSVPNYINTRGRY